MHPPPISGPKASFKSAFGLPKEVNGCRGSLFQGRPEADLKEVLGRLIGDLREGGWPPMNGVCLFLILGLYQTVVPGNAKPHSRSVWFCFKLDVVFLWFCFKLAATCLHFSIPERKFRTFESPMCEHRLIYFCSIPKGGRGVGAGGNY